jgi:hypothetical protein
MRAMGTRAREGGVRRYPHGGGGEGAAKRRHGVVGGRERVERGALSLKDCQAHGAGVHPYVCLLVSYSIFIPYVPRCMDPSIVVLIHAFLPSAVVEHYSCVVFRACTERRK